MGRRDLMRLRGRGRAGATTAAERVLGIDEAGRGSVLGPLVIGAFCCAEDRLATLRGTGVRDSKRLSPRRRKVVYALLPAVGECRSISLTPRTVDRYVVRGALNELELESFAALVREFRPDVAYVDACDPIAERFGRRLAELAGTGARIVSRHKADRDFPVVSAASVVAKVRRDAAMDELLHTSGETLGSGYPSDPETKECVARHARDGGRVPTWMRRSWETVQRVKREHPARTLDRYPA
jgi:ribonuclease HII